MTVSMRIGKEDMDGKAWKMEERKMEERKRSLLLFSFPHFLPSSLPHSFKLRSGFLFPRN
jgi:hypothetical protein